MKWTIYLAAVAVTIMTMASWARAQSPDRKIAEVLSYQEPDVEALNALLSDVTAIEVTFRKGPLTQWADGCQIMDGKCYRLVQLALNRAAAVGQAPTEWIDALTGPTRLGLKPIRVRLAMTPSGDVIAQRDAVLARIDQRLRQGMLALATGHAILRPTNWGTMAQAMQGASPAGQVAIWAGHYAGRGGLAQPLAEGQSYNFIVMLRPIAFGQATGGPWEFGELYPHLGLMGFLLSSSDDPSVDIALRDLVVQSLAELDGLEAANLRKTVLYPTSLPAVESPVPAESASQPAGEPEESAGAVVPPPTSPGGGPVAAENPEQMLKLSAFTLKLYYEGPVSKPFYTLILQTSEVPKAAPQPFVSVVQVSQDQALRVVDYLMKSGWLAKAEPPGPPRAPSDPMYVLSVQVGDITLADSLGWGMGMLRSMEGLRGVLEGPAAREMDVLLGRLSGYRAAWQSLEGPSTAPAQPTASAPAQPAKTVATRPGAAMSTRPTTRPRTRTATMPALRPASRPAAVTSIPAASSPALAPAASMPVEVPVPVPAASMPAEAPASAAIPAPVVAPPVVAPPVVAPPAEVTPAPVASAPAVVPVAEPRWAPASAPAAPTSIPAPAVTPPVAEPPAVESEMLPPPAATKPAAAAVIVPPPQPQSAPVAPAPAPAPVPVPAPAPVAVPVPAVTPPAQPQPVPAASQPTTRVPDPAALRELEQLLEK